MSDSKVTRRRVIQGAATAAAVAVVPGFVREARADQTSQQPVPPNFNGAVGDGGTITMTMASSASGSIASQNFIGLSYDKDWMIAQAYTDGSGNPQPLFNGSSPIAQFFETAGIQVLRFGDGSNNAWSSTQQGTGQMDAGWIQDADVAVLGAFLNTAMNGTCKCLYGINLEGALIDPNNQTPNQPPAGAKFTSTTLAYEEIESANTHLGSLIYGVEIGNEVNNYKGSPDPYTYKSVLGVTNPWKESTLETAWQDFTSAIAAKVPSVRLTGPCYDCENIWPFAGSNSSYWNPDTFASDEKGNGLSLFTQHFYTAFATSPGPNAYNQPKPAFYGTYTNGTLTNQGLLTPYPSQYQVEILQTIMQSQGLAFRISECNTYSIGGASGISNAYGSALWAIDFMYLCAQYGAVGVNFHGGGRAGGSQPVWYTAIDNYTQGTGNNNLVLHANPLYYGILLFHMAGTGTMYPVTSSPANQYVSCFVTETASGSFSIVVNNKDQNNYYAIHFNLPSSWTTTKVATAVITQMMLPTAAGAPVASSLSVPQIGGATVNASGVIYPSSPMEVGIDQNETQVTFWVPALSAVLVQITATS